MMSCRPLHGFNIQPGVCIVCHQTRVRLQERLGPFSINLFVARINVQLFLYCSWHADPAAVAVDALLIPWTKHFPYMFPHSEVPEQASQRASVSNNGCFSLAQATPSFCPGGSHHPLAVQRRLPLAAWPVSREQVALEAILSELSMSSRDLGESQLNQLTPMHGSSGIAGALNGVLIPFQLL